MQLPLVHQHRAITDAVFLYLGHGIIGFGHGEALSNGLYLVALGHTEHLTHHAGAAIRTASDYLVAGNQRIDRYPQDSRRDADETKRAMGAKSCDISSPVL